MIHRILNINMKIRNTKYIYIHEHRSEYCFVHLNTRVVVSQRILKIGMSIYKILDI